MGLLDQVIGGVVGQVLGGGRGGRGQSQGSGLGGALGSPIVQALLMLLVSKAASGGLGDIFGGGRSQPAPRGRHPEQRGDDGDLGGFAGGGSYRGETGGDAGGGAFSDLSGMLDGPGDRGGQSAGSGPYAHLDREPGQDGGGFGGAIGGGLGGLIQSFERNGLGDVIGSWIGHGGNQQIPPNRLADALGSDTIDTLSRRTGLSHDDLLRQLAQALPAVVDQLTPHGRPPNEAEQRSW